MNPAGMQPLARLRDRAGELREAPELRVFADALAGDARRGARALAETLLRRAARLEAEAQRLEQWLALRDRLARAGRRCVAGVDEVGVGPLAGPVVAAAVVLPRRPELPGLDDSKKLSAAARLRLSDAVRAQARAFGIGEVWPEEIDRLNIYQASLEAMRRAVCALPVPADHLLVDARTVPGALMPQTALVRGDARDASIAAASIVAKVHRDAIMCSLDARYPGYGFAQHKGYGTAQHLEALRRMGACPVHRRSFAPVALAAAAPRRERRDSGASAFPAGGLRPAGERNAAGRPLLYTISRHTPLSPRRALGGR